MKECRNVCGPISRSAGQNLATAVMGEWQDVGFPPYNYGKVRAILTQALSPEELDLVCRGFGFGRTRQQQNEIAKELKIDGKSVSQAMSQAIAKMQVSSCKKQLRSLIVTPEDLFTKISDLEQETADSKELKAAKYRLQAAEKQCKTFEVELKQMTEEKAALLDDNQRLANKLDAMTAQITKSNDEVARLVDLVSYHKERERLVKEHLDSTIGEIGDEFARAMAEARKSFIAKVGALEVEMTDGLRGLEITEETREDLHKIGINSISQLTRMSKRNLRKMGIGATRLADVESGLSKKGLSLRVG